MDGFVSPWVTLTSAMARHGRGAGSCRSKSIGWLSPLESQRSGRPLLPRIPNQIRAYAHYHLAHHPAGSGFGALRACRRHSVCYRRFLRFGLSLRLRKSQEGKNAELSANWPFPRILAQSPILFDMDGVITDTASIHAACWKTMFDEYLQKRAKQKAEPFRPFEVATDYKIYVDGKPRYLGVRDFLKSRGICLPEGT